MIPQRSKTAVGAVLGGRRTLERVGSGICAAGHGSREENQFWRQLATPDLRERQIRSFVEVMIRRSEVWSRLLPQLPIPAQPHPPQPRRADVRRGSECGIDDAIQCVL